MNSFRDCRATSFVDEVFVRLLEFECLPADREAWEQLGSDLRTELADDDWFTAALDEPWPVLTRELRFSDPAVGYNRWPPRNCAANRRSPFQIPLRL